MRGGFRFLFFEKSVFLGHPTAQLVIGSLKLSLFIVDTTMAGRVEVGRQTFSKLYNMIELLNKVSLVRAGPGSWGLRLQGGVGL